MDWFLYDIDLRHERVKLKFSKYTAFVKTSGINNSGGIIILDSNTFASAVVETLTKH